MTKKETSVLENIGKGETKALHHLLPSELLLLINSKTKETFTLEDMLTASTKAFTLGYLRGESKRA